ncbi:alpha/beta hydrolase [Aureibaculum luteum]|uniref:alpha/beta hydrolase n=1 Tax=Aureibaculum luteum TaxID=1548456 RepID=UPI000E51D233|nr:alpha/beta hydrolase [Aureibaculum luteum]
MKPRLIILSDLWGIEKSVWINDYTEILDSIFEIQYYDCCDLGQVDKLEYQENNLHNQFINGGIEVATKRLLELEKKRIDVLAFSIGGIIAWKAQLNGLKINTLYSISSTRLRYEKEKPKCNLSLYFGDKDNYKPTSEWFDRIELNPKIFKNKEHKLYTEIGCISEICDDIKTPYNNV